MYHLFLDDIRIPQQVTWVELPMPGGWIIARNYKDFTSIILEKGMPEFIAFDHDLADEHYQILKPGEIRGEYKEKTGADCAHWLVGYCMEDWKDLPDYAVHSMNPEGGKNIIAKLESYRRLLEDKRKRK
jgi:hypothetical protein